jgi:luciferase family oxidoreductase group 1
MPRSIEGVGDLRQIPLSVLDIGPVVQGSSPAAALNAARTLAQEAERLGYQRFWVAEHHNAPNIATAAPAVILGVLGAATSTIRLGSGGVMLPNHPPLVVAEQFGTLSAYYPGRVDLGIGRAPGTDPVAAQALRRLPTERFAHEVRDLLGFLGGKFPSVTAIPGHDSDAEVWILGSGLDSARLAAELGLRYAFAYHLKSADAVEALRTYREQFQPSEHLGAPHTMLSVQVICAEDDAKAKWLSDPSQLSFLRMRTWPAEPFPTPQTAAAHPWTPDERATADQRQAAQAIGGPATVRDRLAEILAATEPDELMTINTVTNLDDRLGSLQRVRGLFA